MYQKPKGNKTGDFLDKHIFIRNALFSMSNFHINQSPPTQCNFSVQWRPKLKNNINLSVRHPLNIYILAKYIVMKILPIKIVTVQNESDSNILPYAVYLCTEVAL